MAVVVTVAKGYDLGYIWKTQSEHHAGRTTGGYYINAAQVHAAELAGLDPAEVISTASASRDLAGARDIAAVLDARIRPRVHPLLPQPQAPWAERVPDLPAPDRHAYLSKIAALMDDRTKRLGQHSAQTTPTWAIAALGPVPANRAALSPANVPNVRTMPDGQLWLIRDTYAAETAWAPPHVGKELRLFRLGAFDAALGAIRSDAEAEVAHKAGDHPRAEQHAILAASYRALRDHYQQRDRSLAQAMADRQEWEHITKQSRHLAIASDNELRHWQSPGSVETSSNHVLVIFRL